LYRPRKIQVNYAERDGAEVMKANTRRTVKNDDYLFVRSSARKDEEKPC